MPQKRFFYAQHLLSFGAAVSSAASMFLVGCGAGSPAPGASIVAAAVQSGRAMGGQQPVSGTVITLWKAGATGYGLGASALYTTSTDSGGNFSLTSQYSCASGDQLYLTAYGGSSNGGAGNNSSIGLVAALGECTAVQATPFIYLNEATTVATMFALQQFAKVTYGTAGSVTVAAHGTPLSIGAPATNLVGLANAFATVNNLSGATVNGIPQTYARAATINNTQTTVTVTPPYLKIATLANIIASCVNTQDGASAVSSGCSSLFTSTQPAGQSNPPADTIQAALDLAINPTNVGTSTAAPPFSLSSPAAPFQPSLASLPTDWTLGLSFTSATLVDPAGSPAYFLYNPYGLQVDSAGNIYVLNQAGAGSATAPPYYNSVTEFSPLGAPVAMYMNGAAANLSFPRAMVLDPGNHIFVNSAFSTAVTEYVNSSTITKYTVTGNASQLVSDSAGNVFASTGGGNIYKITPGTTSATLIGALPSTASKASYLAFDGNLNLWVTATATSSSANDQFVDFFACTPSAGTACSFATTNTYASPTKFTSFPTLNSLPGVPTGIAIDNNNNAFIGLATYAGTGGYGCQFLLTSASVAIANTPACSANLAGGVNLPAQSEIDGNGNVWNTNIKSLTPSYITSGLNYNPTSASFTALTGTKGFNEATIQPQYMQLDQSGNIWQAAQNALAGTYYIYETVGVAAPVYAPLSLALKHNSLGKAPQ